MQSFWSDKFLKTIQQNYRNFDMKSPKSKELVVYSSLDNNLLKQYLSQRSQKMSPISPQPTLYFNNNRSHMEQLKHDRHKTDKSELVNDYNLKKLIKPTKESAPRKPLSQLTEEMRRIYESIPKRKSGNLIVSESRSNCSSHQNSQRHTNYQSKAKISSLSTTEYVGALGSQKSSLSLFDTKNLALQKSYNESYFQEQTLNKRSIIEPEKDTKSLEGILFKTRQILQSYQLKEQKWLERETLYIQKIVKLQAELEKLN